MNFTKHFIRSIPIEVRDNVLKKVKEFEVDLKESKGFTNLSTGYYVRRIQGSDIYKFRVNNGDRILFKYDPKKNDNIMLIEFCKHDEQVRRARNINENLLEVNSYCYDPESKIEEEIDANIEEDILERNEFEYLDAIDKYLLDEDTIGLGVESDELEDKKYLTLEQFSCIKSLDKAKIIFGCAGSGKTLIGIKRIAINSKLDIKTVFITQSKRLKETVKELCNKLNEDSYLVDVLTLEEIALSLLNIDETRVVNYDTFKEWIVNNHSEELINTCGVEMIWHEIQNVLKDTDGDSRLINDRSYYNCESSNIEKVYRKKVYALAVSYDKWLKKIDFYDENDLYKLALAKLKMPIYDFIICDEFQDLNQNAVRLISNLNKNRNNNIFLGDINQRLYNWKNNILGNINLNEYQIATLNKNYRSGDGTVSWINKLKSINKNSNIEKYSIGKEVAVREGELPKYIERVKDLERIFNRVAIEPNSIIIVGNNEIRNEFKVRGYDTSRVFTVYESKGLEYNCVYCINIQKYSTEYGIGNAIYLSATRAKNELIFLEDLDSDFKSIYEGYYNEVSEVDLDLKSELKADMTQWLNEGDKLKKAEKYLQAADAYKKAGSLKMEELCIMAHERKVFAAKLEEQGVYIKICGENITAQILSKVIDKLGKKGIVIQSWIQITSFHIVGGLPKEDYVYMGYNRTSNEISEIILKGVNGAIFRKHELVLKVVTKNTGMNDKNITISNGKINISDFKYDKSFNEYEEHDSRIVKELGISATNTMRKMEMEEEVKRRDTKSILSEIFGELD